MKVLRFLKIVIFGQEVKDVDIMMIGKLSNYTINADFYTKAKEDSTASRRVVFSYLQNKFAVTELFKVISEKVANRPGGYTRIIKLGTRQGDAAEMCFIELVDFDENMAKAPKAAKKTRRSRKAAAEAETPATEEPKAE